MYLKKSLFVLAVAGGSLLSGCWSDGSKTPPAPKNTDLVATDGTSIYYFAAEDRTTARKAALTGLNAGTTLLEIDANPNGGALVGLGSDGQAYTISGSSATALGSRDTTANFNSTFSDIDFNPRAQNVFRVVSSLPANYRQRGNVPANSAAPTAAPGAKIADDISFTYPAGSVNSPVIAALAYTNSGINNAVTPASTVAFVIDTANDTLSRLGGNPADGTACPNATNPNCGQLTKIGDLGVDLEGEVGFDIKGTENYGLVTALLRRDPHLFRINLSTGVLEDLGILPPLVEDPTGFAIVQQ